MFNNVNSIFEELKNLVGRDIEIIQDGFLKSKYSINKLKYFIENGILNILDEESENYLKINLNQIYYIEFLKNTIKLYMDNDTIICLII